MGKAPDNSGDAARSRAGHPGHGNRKITPADYDDIGKLWASGWTFRKIAEKYGVNHNTVSTHFKNNIFPMIKASSTRSIEAELVKIDTLERIAWECFWSEDPDETRDTVKEQLEKLASPRAAERREASTAIEKTITKVHRARDRGWLDVVKWCIDMRCRLEGHFAAAKVTVKLEEYRVAGQTPADGMESMLNRILQKVQERREYENRIGLMAQGKSPSDN